MGKYDLSWIKDGWLKDGIRGALEEYEKIPAWRRRMIRTGLD